MATRTIQLQWEGPRIDLVCSIPISSNINTHTCYLRSFHQSRVAQYCLTSGFVSNLADGRWFNQIISWLQFHLQPHVQVYLLRFDARGICLHSEPSIISVTVKTSQVFIYYTPGWGRILLTEIPFSDVIKWENLHHFIEIKTIVNFFKTVLLTSSQNTMGKG